MSEQINPYEVGSSWTVFNPTPRVVTTMFDGKEIIIKPFSKFETAHKVVHDHILSNVNNQNFGLVSYTFTDEMRRLHATEQEFQKSRAIEGLRKLEEFFSQTLYYENVAAQANKLQKVPIFLKSKVDQFEKDLKEIQSLITNYLEKTNEQGPDPDKSAPETRRVGRPPLERPRT